MMNDIIQGHQETWHYVENLVSYNDKKNGKQIAGYKVEMCKSKIKTKLIPFASIRMVYGGRVIIL